MRVIRSRSGDGIITARMDWEVFSDHVRNDGASIKISREGKEFEISLGRSDLGRLIGLLQEIYATDPMD